MVGILDSELGGPAVGTLDIGYCRWQGGPGAGTLGTSGDGLGVGTPGSGRDGLGAGILGTG